MGNRERTDRWNRTRRVIALLAVVPVIWFLGAMVPSAWGGGTEETLALSPEEVDTLPSLPAMARDPRVRAILENYGSLIDSVDYSEDEAVFLLPGGDIYLQDGRMLLERNMARADRFHSLFYDYSLEHLRNPPPLTDLPIYSTDFLEALFGRTEPEIRRQGVSTSFLNRKVFVNTFCLEALQAVERRIFAVGERDPEVATWIENIEVAYSFIDKEIVGSGSRSHHAWGLAIDLVPTSYGGKHVYWRWSRVFNRQDWHRIPIGDRWTPPRAVIDAFEAHGFIWGGKWPHFDTIHFEYRPEILAYNRMVGYRLP